MSSSNEEDSPCKPPTFSTKISAILPTCISNLFSTNFYRHSDKNMSLNNPSEAKRRRMNADSDCTQEPRCSSTNSEPIHSEQIIMFPLKSSQKRKREVDLLHSNSEESPQPENCVPFHSSDYTNDTVKSVNNVHNDSASVTSESLPAKETTFHPGQSSSYTNRTTGLMCDNDVSKYTRVPNRCIPEFENIKLKSSGQSNRVLHLLENYSSPVNEVKSISKFVNEKRSSSKSSEKLKSFSKKQKQLIVPSISSILKIKRKSNLMDTTTSARQLLESQCNLVKLLPTRVLPSVNNQIESNSPLTENIETLELNPISSSATHKETENMNTSHDTVMNTNNEARMKNDPPQSVVTCDVCWVQNDLSSSKCVCCGAPVQQEKVAKAKPSVIEERCGFQNNTKSGGSISDTSLSLDKINTAKSKKESWECTVCLVANDMDKCRCVCCEAEKPGAKMSKITFNFNIPSNTSFKFGIEPKTTKPVPVALPKPDINVTPIAFSFGIPTENSSVFGQTKPTVSLPECSNSTLPTTTRHAKTNIQHAHIRTYENSTTAVISPLTSVNPPAHIQSSMEMAEMAAKPISYEKDSVNRQISSSIITAYPCYISTSSTEGENDTFVPNSIRRSSRMQNQAANPSQHSLSNAGELSNRTSPTSTPVSNYAKSPINLDGVSNARAGPSGLGQAPDHHTSPNDSRYLTVNAQSGESTNTRNVGSGQRVDGNHETFNLSAITNGEVLTGTNLQTPVPRALSFQESHEINADPQPSRASSLYNSNLFTLQSQDSLTPPLVEMTTSSNMSRSIESNRIMNFTFGNNSSISNNNIDLGPLQELNQYNSPSNNLHNNVSNDSNLTSGTRAPCNINQNFENNRQISTGFPGKPAPFTPAPFTTSTPHGLYNNQLPSGGREWPVADLPRQNNEAFSFGGNISFGNTNRNLSVFPTDGGGVPAFGMPPVNAFGIGMTGQPSNPNGSFTAPNQTNSLANTNPMPTFTYPNQNSNIFNFSQHGPNGVPPPQFQVGSSSNTATHRRIRKAVRRNTPR